MNYSKHSEEITKLNELIADLRSRYLREIVITRQCIIMAKIEEYIEILRELNAEEFYKGVFSND